MTLDSYDAERPAMGDFLSLRSKSKARKGKPKSGSTHETSKSNRKVYSADFSEKLDDDNPDANKSNEHRKKKAPKKATKNSHKADVDVNAVPNPAPNIGPSKTQDSVHPTMGIYSGVLPVNPPPLVSSASASTSGFSPLPPLAAFATTVSSTASSTYSTPSISSTVAAPSSSSTNHATSASRPPQHLSVVVIVLLAVGTTLLLVSGFIIFRVCTRPRKHHVPTPSLPILQDPFQDEKKSDPDEESLFGGKERASVRDGNEPILLDWTQYPHTSMIQKPQPTPDVRPPPANVQKRNSRIVTPAPVYPFKSSGVSSGNLAAPATNRLSALSVSVYPGSPTSTSIGQGTVGIAVSSSPFTADNHLILQRSNSKATARRMSQSSRNVRQSVISSYGTSDLYGGVTSPIPATPKVTVAQAIVGRARVKASYAPATIRASTTAPVAGFSHTTECQNPFEETPHILPPFSPIAKSEDKRERDTKALASALGLASPAPEPVSPPMTLYPDDSITLAGDRRRRSRSQILSPTMMDDTARLGKFMMGEFQSMGSLPSTRIVPGAGTNGPRMPKPALRKRVEEKPPRVPSPPPMPSLAQMALAHSNPQDFEDYRSPTYSIYGLYGPDRKSRNPGEGGY